MLRKNIYDMHGVLVGFITSDDTGGNQQTVMLDNCDELGAPAVLLLPPDKFEQWHDACARPNEATILHRAANASKNSKLYKPYDPPLGDSPDRMLPVKREESPPPTINAVPCVTKTDPELRERMLLDTLGDTPQDAFKRPDAQLELARKAWLKTFTGGGTPTASTTEVRAEAERKHDGYSWLEDATDRVNRLYTERQFQPLMGGGTFTNGPDLRQIDYAELEAGMLAAANYSPTGRILSSTHNNGFYPRTFLKTGGLSDSGESYSTKRAALPAPNETAESPKPDIMAITRKFCR